MPMTLAFSGKVVHIKLWKSVNICKSYSKKKLVAPFFLDTVYIHQMNRVNSCNGSAMMALPWWQYLKHCLRIIIIIIYYLLLLMLTLQVIVCVYCVDGKLWFKPPSSGIELVLGCYRSRVMQHRKQLQVDVDENHFLLQHNNNCLLFSYSLFYADLMCSLFWLFFIKL